MPFPKIGLRSLLTLPAGEFTINWILKMLFDFGQFTGIALVILIIWMIGLSVLFYRLLAHYQKLTAGITKKDLKSILEALLDNTQREVKRVDGLVADLAKANKDALNHVQKVGLIRFNPFAETGGNQSFCLAVLDDHDSGFVISSLHGREATRFYAKPVRHGKATNYDFSSEEKQAIKNAKKVK
ncbi:hypothetical protein COU97_01275 [Candidatus Shapirobacteria bacterium CG10_big_fil_rev_8_21_14_0_10_48_15]|uniref:DUF4446 domain-containing protein n=1 Tax=Candidatus Shapirobacteria bacterium CG10_big_fil_rev_8_21_14_0_10_48_15 TaxID=1974484 RepID=A0A2M8L7H9_9BACT|nr:MAG: hypothetical protein COU97_01275 [Candidatus Shapirobacteria bacterium CG10_big_fil_rev_8_21_14_0_10_48_15]